MEIIDAVAPSRATVLLEGESGTGKELFAPAPFTRAALVRTDPTSGQLRRTSGGSGRERAVRAREGRLHRRDGPHRRRVRARPWWTLLLDEISEMRLDLQSKLLRVIQEQEFERVGGAEAVKVTSPDRHHQPRLKAETAPPVSSGPLLSAERRPDPDASAARAAGGHPPARPAFPAALAEQLGLAVPPLRPRRSPCCSLTSGRATSGAGERDGAGVILARGGPLRPRRSAHLDHVRPSPPRRARWARCDGYLLRPRHPRASRHSACAGGDGGNRVRAAKLLGSASEPSGTSSRWPTAAGLLVRIALRDLRLGAILKPSLRGIPTCPTSLTPRSS